METISKGKVALTYLSAALAALIFAYVFVLPILWLTGFATEGGGGFIGLTNAELYFIIGSIVGFFFCLSFAQLAFVHSYWKLFWPVLVVAILLALITGLIWFALAYAVVGALAGWLWRRWRRR